MIIKDYADPPYSIDEIFVRHVLDNLPNPDDPLFPIRNIKEKRRGGFLSGLIGAIAPTGPIGIGDSSSADGVNVIDQYSLPQIGYTEMSDPNSAWNAVDTKGPNVTVAVIDSGLDSGTPRRSPPLANLADGSHGWNFIDENTDLRDLQGSFAPWWQASLPPRPIMAPYGRDQRRGGDHALESGG